MASINSVQKPTQYTAIHSNNGVKEYQDFNFTFVPIPNNEATHDDLATDISQGGYYNIYNKSFYAEIDTKDHTTPDKLQGIIDNTSLEQVVYAPASDTTTIIYKVSNDDNEEYKCSREGVRIISFGDDTLKDKDLNASMNNVIIHCTDGSQLCSIDDNYTDANNSVINIQSTGQVKIEIPNDVVVSSAELISDDIYLKGTFTSETTENFFICKYSKDGKQHCNYTNKIVPKSIISSSDDNTSTIQLGNSKFKFTPNSPVYADFLKVNGDVKTGELLEDEWESTGNSKNSDYILHTEGEISYVKIGNSWYNLNDVNYTYDETTNQTIITGNTPLDDININSPENPTYLQYVTYVQKVYVVDNTKTDSKGYYLIKNGGFGEGFSLDKTNPLQLIFSSFFDETENAENRFCTLDTEFKLVVDTDTNEIVYKDDSATLASLKYNTTSN